MSNISNNEMENKGRYPDSPEGLFTPWECQNISLAVVAQCAELVSSLAQHGNANEQQIIACVNPLLVVNPQSVADIYPRVGQFNNGLKSLQNALGNVRENNTPDVIRYIMGMLVLRKKFMANTAMQTYVRDQLTTLSPINERSFASGVAAADKPKGLYETTSEIPTESMLLYGHLANLYQETISTLPYRIQVQGKLEHLRNDRTAHKIRSLLLAGIRSAVLWHQLGGRRWRLLIYRARVRESVSSIRRKLITTI